MSLSSETLANLIAGSSPGMTPHAAMASARAAQEIRVNGVTARLESPESLALQSIMISHGELLSDTVKARLASVSLFGVESSYINAFAFLDGHGRENILVCDGLRQLVHYFADLITVLGLLMKLRPGATIGNSEGNRHDEAELFSMAGFVLLSDYLETGRFLPNLHEMLGEQHRQNVKHGFMAAMIFVMLHELAHLHLGHVLLDRPKSEAAALALLEPERLSVEQQDELDADAQALQWIGSDYRGPIQSSLIFLMGSHAFVEAFSGGLSQSHPLSINRLSRLAHAAQLPAEERDIVHGWITDRARNFRELAAARSASGGSIRVNIYRALSVEQAWTVVNEVKRRVATEHGHLE